MHAAEHAHESQVGVEHPVVGPGRWQRKFRNCVRLHFFVHLRILPKPHQGLRFEERVSLADAPQRLLLKKMNESMVYFQPDSCMSIWRFKK